MDDIISRLAVESVARIHVASRVVTINGIAPRRGAAVTRALWYQGLAAVALSYRTDIRGAARRVLAPNGSRLERQLDLVARPDGDPLDLPTRDASELQADIVTGANASALRLQSFRYVNLFGGAADISVRPRRTANFLNHASHRIGLLLAPWALGGGPFLVEVEDHRGRTLLLTAFVPDLGGEVGQGLTWIAPTVEAQGFGMS